MTRTLLSLLFLGLLLGRAAAQPLTGFTAHGAAAQRRLEERFLELPNSESFRQHLKILTREPHPAGSAANARVGEYIAGVMERAGLQVSRYPYDVYMPELNPDIHVALVTPLRLPLNNQEYILEEDPYSGHPDLQPGWNAYSASGDVTAEVVYVNYGRREDFERLRQLGVEIKGKIAIARYGGNYRGYKVKYAEEQGAVGVILYTDPADGGYVSGPVYPEGHAWNESAVQRGSTLTLPYKGDPLTPFAPALPLDSGKQVKRLKPEEVGLPAIPVTPLPYGSAVEILQRMQGPAVPPGWQGGLPFTYRLSGGPELTVRLRVHQPKRLTRITNIVGTLPGREFPDEWIILGAHYDAWEFGAVDPNSGTAMLLTLAEALGALAQQGQPPRRTIKIAHWDAEEFGIIGSVEWVEQFHRELSTRAVAYINADVAVFGPTFGAAASPSLKTLIIEAAHAVPYPGSEASLFTHWHPPTRTTPEPALGNLGGGSDHIGFYGHLGIPAAAPLMSGPSLYHSAYDTFAFFARFCDPEFVYGPTMSRLDGLIALRLANADLLPYDPGRYAADLLVHQTELEKRAAQLGMEVRLENFHAAIQRLEATARTFAAARDQRLAAGDLPARQLRQVNQRLIALERAFIHPEGLQEQAWYRSLYSAPDPFSGYAAWVLPGLRYAVETGTPEQIAPWETIYTRAVEQLDQQLQQAIGLLR